MGFFGVLQESATQTLAVGRLDLNLWCLPTLLGRYSLVCDVGIEIEALGEPLSGFRLALPFRASEFRDLSPCLRRPATASLIFGEPVDVLRQGEAFRFKNEEFSVATIDPDASRLDAQKPAARYSMFHAALTSPLAPGGKAYARLRFTIKNPGRLWVWGRDDRGAKSVVVDIRVADLREAIILDPGHTLGRQILEVGCLNCFVILPASFRRSLASPDVRYLRLLEAEEWQSYLPRRSRSPKLLVHFWRKEKVSTKNEFRGLLAVSVPAPRASLGALAVPALAAVAAVLLLSSAEDLETSLLVQGAVAFTPYLKSAWLWATGAAAGLFIFHFTYPDVIPAGWAGLKRVLAYLRTRFRRDSEENA